MKVTLFTIILALTLQNVWAQERLTGVIVNPAVKKTAQYYKSSRQVQQALNLPFFDDFSSKKSVFPDNSHWTDNYVYINDDYSFNPPTVGVATFDAINNFGELYAQGSPFPFGADTLTSVEIRLDSIFTGNPDKITVADNLYFSFYYQPQGTGNNPAPGDSLILEFLAPAETDSVFIPADTVATGTDTIYIPADTIILESWIRMWSSSGEILEHFVNKTGGYFKQVILPIADSARFYRPDFRFRFRNLASLADGTLPDWQSNGDQWNIDYIYLNTDRAANDTLYPDVAFAGKAPNMLSRYTSMPFDQYRQKFVTEMADSLEIKITNLGSIDYSVEYKYEVTDRNNNLIHLYDGGNYFVPPFVTSGYLTWQKFARPEVDFIYPINSQSPVTFTTTHIIETDANLGRRENDTIRQKQVFSNYLSYDDGTAEAGYGMSAQGAQVAYKFQLNKNDSLYGVNLFFNQTLNQGNVQDFYLNVWNDYFGEPGDLIYSKFGYQPVFEDSLNKFFYYEFDSALFIEPGRFPTLTFYVGWTQTTNDLLNIGFDRNNDASSHTFTKTFNDWSNSIFSGALMIRPIIGIEKVLSLGEKTSFEKLIVYPNPVTINIVRISTNIDSRSTKEYQIAICTTDGRTIKRMPLTEEIEINNISNGIYFIQLIKNERVVSVQKLIVNR